ncbi:RNA polymerase sigma factor [Parapedobacter tibetensis]|uniref:RNA polymerase sigma factor n=1 Tax=Parapedobacter tibetensis TaxID=2972951 RepID=UPI00214D9721|nr:RNA polymerase sigma-70 factor [Parapedobacter tibetensis]
MADQGTDSERNWIIRMQKGDTQALSEVYLHYYQRLSYFILRTAKSPALTEDVVHDTFVKVWEKRIQIDPAQSLRPYIYTIARRLLLNLLNRAGHETAILSEMRNFVSASENSTGRALDYGESEELVREALERLPDRCREVFVKCQLEGLSYKETAAQLGISENTVSNQMVKALKIVREHIRMKHGLALLLGFITGLAQV